MAIAWKLIRSMTVEQLKDVFEKLMLGTFTRILMAIFATLTFRFGLPVIGETEVGEIAKWVVSSGLILLSLIWSKKVQGRFP